MTYKVVMLSYTDDHIVMARGLTFEEAQKVLKECEQEDGIHYFEIKEEC